MSEPANMERDWQFTVIVRGLLPFEKQHIRVAPVLYMNGHRQSVAVGGDADFLRIYYFPADFVR